MFGSHSIFAVAMFDNIKSMHDLSFPLLNVLHAIGPGCSPFSICDPCISHTSMSHGALLLVILSLLLLWIVVSSIVGDNSPTRVFQLPHTSYVSLQEFVKDVLYHASRFLLVHSSSLKTC